MISGNKINNPVSIHDLRSVLSESSLDEGTLCKSSNINKWAKYKPVACGSVGPLTPEEFRIQRSIMPPGYGTPITTYYGLIIGHSTDLSYQLHDTSYIYIKPFGGLSSPYRIQDFYCNLAHIGYDHDAEPSVHCEPQYAVTEEDGKTYYRVRSDLNEALEVLVVHDKKNETGINIMEFEATNTYTPKDSDYYVLALISYGYNNNDVPSYNYIRALYHSDDKTSDTQDPPAKSMRDNDYNLFKCSLPDAVKNYSLGNSGSKVQLTFFLMQDKGSVGLRLSSFGPEHIDLRTTWGTLDNVDVAKMPSHPIALPMGIGLNLVVLAEYSTVGLTSSQLVKHGVNASFELSAFFSFDPWPENDTKRNKYTFSFFIDDERVMDSPTKTWLERPNYQLAVVVDTGLSTLPSSVSVRFLVLYQKDSMTNLTVLNETVTIIPRYKIS